MFCSDGAEIGCGGRSSVGEVMNLRLMTAYAGATLIIGVALAMSVAAILLKGYSRGWLLIPISLFIVFGFGIRRLQG